MEWVAVFPDGREHSTATDDAHEAIEDTDSWCEDCGVEPRYELVARE